MSFDPNLSSLATSLDQLRPDREFIRRHIGPDAAEREAMLAALGCDDIEHLLNRTLPAAIRAETTRALPPPLSEAAATAELKALAARNQVYRCHIGAGYYPTHTPAVIRRNVLENPAWYTAYTPYQPEISQGRLEGLLNFQQLVMDLTGLDMANASMLDEATACAEAMAMSHRLAKGKVPNRYFVAADVHPQTLAVVQTRARHFGFEVVVAEPAALAECECFGALLQYPGSHGAIHDLRAPIAAAHARGSIVTVAADLMALVLLEGPAAFGADMVVGSAQRFGVPMGFGGPHAAFFAFRESYKRAAPGRIIGVSKDRAGKQALRMAMQTREQHIRREKANSNICTSQVLLALISAFYAMYHGPEGLRQIALRIHLYTKILAEGLLAGGLKLRSLEFFDTLTLAAGDHQQALLERARAAQINLRALPGGDIGISLDETCDDAAVEALLDALLGRGRGQDFQALEARALKREALPTQLLRKTPILTHPNFSRYHSETEMLRYLKRLQSRDLALDHAMIPLGSCTMKLNAASEMEPISWPQFANLHPFAPMEQAAGYSQLFTDLEQMLVACTGYDHVSLQPNAGSQGEYAGLVAIREYFAARGESGRVNCLIPVSAHGTNPASAQMVGLKVVLVACDRDGNVDVDDLRAKVRELGETIAALMITYPSTHGVFEERVKEICEITHSVGAQVYIDGANMNALVGLAAPGQFGGDVSHLNLHKTFCIPHGGGGPGMGPIGVKAHLAPFLPGHPLQPVPGTDPAHGTISAAPWGSAGILPISWMYLRMMGAEGVRQASAVAILNANYVAQRLAPHYPILYAGREGFVAHECLLDLRPLKQSSGITEEDIAKRLMDYGYHAPTMSFPVPGTLMIEPTESESKAELDRFCEAMIAIRGEIARVEMGEWPAADNPLVNAPHTRADLMAEVWSHPYSRAEAAEPLPYLKQHKVWPSVARIDNVYGDRNVMCACPPMDAYSEQD